MRLIKLLLATLVLTGPGLAGAADASTVWYLHVDLAQMRADGPGQTLYRWLQDEAFDDINDKAGVDMVDELNQLTAYAVEGQGPVLLLDGNITQQVKDMVMTIVAAEGDIRALESSGKAYYRLGGDGDDVEFKSDNITVDFDSLSKQAWITTSLKDRILVTTSEDQMKSLLRSKGRIPGAGSGKGALMVLTAEKALLQASMNSDAMGEDGNSTWDSNILRNTEQVALLVAAMSNTLAIEAQLVTTEPDMAESLASVARGLISLAAFDDSMDANLMAMLRGTKVEAKGSNLSISLAVDPDAIVAALGD